MTQHNVLMLGLAESGKTTFLAALWHLLNTDQASAALAQVGWPSERGYLNDIADKWLRCEPQERTKPLSPERAMISLSNPDQSLAGEIWFPDLSGETFQGQWEDRRWSVGFDGILDTACGVLAFIHVEKIEEPVGIDVERELAGQLASSEDDSDAPEPDSSVIPWEPRLAPTQTIMVDLLQLLQSRLRRPRLPVAVVLSAWDKAEEGAPKPRVWMHRRLPLLAQYLESNRDVLPYRVFGVSAQGGDYNTDAAALASKLDAWQRIVVKVDGETSHDLTTIVEWALGEVAP